MSKIEYPRNSSQDYRYAIGYARVGERFDPFAWFVSESDSRAFLEIIQKDEVGIRFKIIQKSDGKEI